MFLHEEPMKTVLPKSHPTKHLTRIQEPPSRRQRSRSPRQRIRVVEVRRTNGKMEGRQDMPRSSSRSSINSQKGRPNQGLDRHSEETQEDWERVTYRRDRPGKQQGMSLKNTIRVKCRRSTHPGSWRDSLKTLDREAYYLVEWVKRDPTDDGWLTVQCEARHEEELSRRLQLNFTTEKVRNQNGTTKRQVVKRR